MRDLPTLEMGLVMTPFHNAICVETGSIDGERLKRLQIGGFDQAPLVASGNVIGLVPRSRLEALSERGEAITPEDSNIVITTISAASSLGDVMKAVEQDGMASIRQYDGTLVGFYDVSDLNKHPVRALMYPLFAELESKLARLMTGFFADPWTWLEKLDKEKQARLVGYWELGKRDNVDVGPLAGTTLSELSAIVTKTKPIRELLGFSSGNMWSDFFGNLVDLRNAIMHPVRPLFLNKESVVTIHGQLAKVLTLIERIDTCDKGEAISG